MLAKIQAILYKHVKNNAKTYFFLLMAFIVGVSAGAFTVNGLSAVQRDELTQYFEGFFKLLDYQSVDNGELLSISIRENVRIVLALWILGVSIIGIPFIYFVVGVRGFITGFSSGMIIEAIGLKGILFAVLALLPKEILIVPCILAMGVNGVNFSLNIIRKRSGHREPAAKHTSKESLKTSFLAYCMTTGVLFSIIFIGMLLEAYILPVFIRIISPILVN